MSQFSNFRDSGMPTAPLNKWHVQGSNNDVIAAPGAGYRIVITDLYAGGPTLFRSGGNSLWAIGDDAGSATTSRMGTINFSKPLALGENEKLSAEKGGAAPDSGATYNIGVIYFIEKA
jgi:hypothetical protein